MGKYPDRYEEYDLEKEQRRRSKASKKKDTVRLNASDKPRPSRQPKRPRRRDWKEYLEEAEEELAFEHELEERQRGKYPFKDD